MLHLAYDGSIHSDWVAHYAARLAANAAARRLVLIHVDEGRLSRGELDERVERVRQFCEMLSVQVEIATVVVRGARGGESADVAAAILGRVPAGREGHLLCGTRVRQRGRGYLSGTVSEALLRSGHCNVLALRVVQPGVLGLPREFLLPVAGHPQGIGYGLVFLRMFAPDLDRVHVLHVKRVRASVLHSLGRRWVDRLRTSAWDYVRWVEGELAHELDLLDRAVTASVAYSDDVPGEIVLTAERIKSRLICMGASVRNLPRRFVYGNPIERVLRDAPCDVAVHRCLP